MRNIFRRKDKAAFPYKISWPAVPIVGDAGIASGMVGDGRFIPLLILDTSRRPDIADMIAIQANAPPGDVDSAWCQIQSGPKDHLALLLQFHRPVELGVTLNFDLGQYGDAVELALRSRSLYLRGGKPGDRYFTTINVPTMTVELGANFPHGQWTELWFKAIFRKLRREGLGRWESRRTASAYIARMRKTTDNPQIYPSGVYIDSSNAREPGHVMVFHHEKTDEQNFDH